MFDNFELFENPYHAEEIMHTITDNPEACGDFIFLCVIKRIYNCIYKPVMPIKERG